MGYCLYFLIWVNNTNHQALCPFVDISLCELCGLFYHRGAQRRKHKEALRQDVETPPCYRAAGRTPPVGRELVAIC
jgi:hypothetical protein